METLKLTFVNVGYGEAALVECPDPAFRGGRFTMLIDGGRAEHAEFADRSSGRVPLAEYLLDRGLDHIDCMVGTHIHEDHTCGLLPVAERLAPGVFWQNLPRDFYRTVMRPLEESAAQNPSQSKFLRALNDYQKLCGTVTAHGGAIRTMRAGEEGELCQGLRFRVLAAGNGELTELCRGLFAETDPAAFLKKLSALDARMNNFSLMLRLEYRGTRILLPGDTNCLGYGGLPPEELRAKLFKVGHHGQRDGVTEALMKAIRPEAVVCCASSDRRYESAHPGTLGMIARSGAHLYFSDCPRLPGLTDGLAPHRALEFTVGAEGSWLARYLSE